MKRAYIGFQRQFLPGAEPPIRLFSLYCDKSLKNCVHLWSHYVGRNSYMV